MYQIDEIKLHEQATIRKALEVIDVGAMKIALVVDDTDRLIGTLSDGDIRRGFLRGLTMEDPIRDIYNHHPLTVTLNDSKEDIIQLAVSRRLYQIPVVNEAGQVIRLAEIDRLLQQDFHSNPVVIMAGGLGSRLKSLTQKIPKPMLPVGGRPILEIVINRFLKFGYHRFIFTLNYRGEQIKNWFGNGRSFGAEIEYVEETKPLGTAGALSLLNHQPNEPFFVMNADILTHVNFESLMDFHLRNEAAATMCIREFGMEVPYGVVQLNKDNIVGIEEKPVQQFFVNAGIYVLNPEILDIIPPSQHLDMTRLFEMVVEKGDPTLSFPIKEFWMDIGKTEDYERANNEYSNYFNEQ